MPTAQVCFISCGSSMYLDRCVGFRLFLLQNIWNHNCEPVLQVRISWQSIYSWIWKVICSLKEKSIT